MCGLVGVAGSLLSKDEDLIKRLLFFDYFRGPDSTGLASIRSNGDTMICKKAVNPLELFDYTAFKATCKGFESKAFIGHNRHATRGGVNNANAHPFQIDHITGAHNGTLEDKDIPILEKIVGEKYGTDSELLFAAIAKVGAEEAISSIYEGKDSLRGAWALTWYDSDENTLNFLRNKHRPLWYAWEKGFKRLVWASEWWIMQACLNMGTAIDLYQEEDTLAKYWKLPEDKWYKIKLDVLLSGGEKVPEYEVKDLKGKEPEVVQTYTGGTNSYNPFDRSNITDETNMGFRPTSTGSGTPRTQKKTGSMTDSKASSKTALIHLLGDIGDPFAGYMTKEEFDNLTKLGCTWCEMPMTYGDPGITIYDREQLILCPQCSGHCDIDEFEDNPASRVYMPGPKLESYLG